MSAEPVAVPADAPDAVQQAQAALAAGQLVLFPTDTVYGLAARADDETAVAKLFAAKQRPEEKALPLLLADAEQLAEVAAEVPAAARVLAEAFWPGPLTIVLRKNAIISDLVTGGLGTVGVRVPDLAIARSILRACGFPIAVTSANLSGDRPACTVADLPQALRAQVSIIIDGGHCAGQTPSTVADVTTDPPRILREGPISAEAIRQALREHSL